jgi:hypothetical protein
MRRVGLLFLVLLAGLAGQLPEAAAAAQPTELPALRTTYLVGLDIHTRSGRVVHVPLPHNFDKATTLLGRSPRGWVVEASNKYYVVSDGTATRIGRAPYPATVFPTKTQLSDDGGYIAQSHSDYFVFVSAFDLDGNDVDHWTLDNMGGDVEDASGNHVYVGVLGALYELSVGEGRRKVARRTAGLVSIEHDTVFFGQDFERSGPTRLSDPGVVRWRTTAQPRSMSPQGSLVAASTSAGKVAVLRMSDGKQVRTWRGYCSDCFDEIAWQGERYLLFNTWNSEGSRQALKRCDVRTGRCRLATPWSRYRYSLPGSEHYVQNYPPGFVG